MNHSLKFKAIAYCSSILGLLALSCSLAFGQAISGNLSGTVVDPSGAAVNGAQVVATNVGTGQRITATTKGTGQYLFSDLPVGTYNIAVTAPNFETTNLNDIPVVLNKTGTANVQLQVGKSSTTVEVSGASIPVDTSTAQLESSYTDRFAQELGMTGSGAAGAGVLNLSLLSPGVTNASAMEMAWVPPLAANVRGTTTLQWKAWIITIKA